MEMLLDIPHFHLIPTLELHLIRSLIHSPIRFTDQMHPQSLHYRS